MLRAIDIVGDKDCAAILDTRVNTEDFLGLIGMWRFDENGDTTPGTISLNTVTEGQVIFHDVNTPPER